MAQASRRQAAIEQLWLKKVKQNLVTFPEPTRTTEM